MKFSTRNLILMLLMFCAATGAYLLRPTERIADKGPKIELERMVPHAFGGWVEEKQSQWQVIDPQTQEMLNVLYSQTLSRTYVNADGYRIMLSIAYGSDQSDSMQVHKPEICYPAQGFTLQGKRNNVLNFGQSVIPVIQIQTVMGQRSEPVTYWTTIGNEVVQSGIHKKFTEMRYGLTGKIPDGMLIRVSSIDANTEAAYQMQAKFVEQMLKALAPESLQRFTGLNQLN